MEERQLRIRDLDDQQSNDDLREHTAAECVQMVWPLTQQAWAFKEAASSSTDDRLQSRLVRRIVRLRRRKC